MNLYHLFYWITVAERVQTFLHVLAVLFTILIGANIIFYLVAKFSYINNIRDNYNYTMRSNRLYIKWAKRIFLVFIPLTSLLWILFIAVPSKSDSILIVAGGTVGEFVKSDSSAKKIPADITNFLHEKIGELTREAKLDVFPTKQDETMKKLEGMTKEQILEQIKTDTTISKLVK